MVELTTMPARVAGEMGLRGVVRWSWFSGLGTEGVGVGDGVETGDGVENGEGVESGEGVEVVKADDGNGFGGVDVGTAFSADVETKRGNEDGVMDALGTSIEMAGNVEMTDAGVSEGVATRGGGCGATGAGSFPVFPNLSGIDCRLINP